MLNNRIVNWNELVAFTSEGMQIADYVTIRAAVTARFKEIYGDNIDVSTASADGVYLETYCLIINNILQAFKSLYANLDVNVASGKSLEVLAALTNIYRKAATYSTASLTVTLDSAELTYRAAILEFSDINGNTWSAKASDFQLDEFVLEPGVPQTILVTCDQLGPIVAQAGTEANDWTDGWIDKTVSLDAIIKVQQMQDATVGESKETDSQLRARRNSSTGTNAVSVLEALSGALFDLDGIRDVLIYNNASDEQVYAGDYTGIKAHNVFIILRQRANTVITDALIGTLIYEHMTPGIATTKYHEIRPPWGVGDYGTSHEFRYQQSFLGEPIDLEAPQMVYWSVCNEIAPKFRIRITPNQYFASSGNNTCNLLGQALIEQFNAKRIGEEIYGIDVDSNIANTDPLFRGRRTFSLDGMWFVTEDSTTHEEIETELILDGSESKGHTLSYCQCYSYSRIAVTQIGLKWQIDIY